MFTPETRKAIRKALAQELGAAEDNLYRAEASFRGLDQRTMGQTYGESGQTRQEIVDGYRAWRDQAKAAIVECSTTLREEPTP